MFGFKREPFELPSAGFFSLDENQSPLCLDGIRLPLSTTFGGAAGSSTGLSAPGQTIPSLRRRYKSFIPFMNCYASLNGLPSVSVPYDALSSPAILPLSHRITR